MIIDISMYVLYAMSSLPQGLSWGALSQYCPHEDEKRCKWRRTMITREFERRIPFYRCAASCTHFILVVAVHYGAAVERVPKEWADDVAPTLAALLDADTHAIELHVSAKTLLAAFRQSLARSASRISKPPTRSFYARLSRVFHADRKR